MSNNNQSNMNQLQNQTKKEKNNEKIEIENKNNDNNILDCNSPYSTDTDLSSSENNDEYCQLDQYKYKKFLNELFPSKYMEKQIEKYEKIDDKVNKKMDKKTNTKNKKRRIILEKCEEREDDIHKYDRKEKNEKVSNKKNKFNLTKYFKYTSSSDNDSEYCSGDDEYDSHEYDSDEYDSDNYYYMSDEYDSDESYESEDDYDSEEEYNRMKKDKLNFNIIFTVDDKKGRKNYEYDADESEQDSETESEYNSECEYNKEKESHEKKNDENNKEKEIKELKKEKTSSKKQNSYKIKQKTKKNDLNEKPKQKQKHDINEKYNKNNIDIVEKTFHSMMDLLQQRKEDIYNCDDIDEEGKKHAIKKFEEYMKIEEAKMKKIREKENKKKQRKNIKLFREKLRMKNNVNDHKYFATLSVEKQHKILEELNEISKYASNDKPYRISLIESSIPIEYKASALQKINSLKYLDVGSGEYFKIKHWIDTFMKIPFGSYNKLPVHISDGIEKCNEFMKNAKNILDKAVYGLDDAKMQIMQLVGQWISNPEATGTAIAIKGPMGTGKTTLVKEGISKILDRPFAFIPLGGATDSSYLEGHSYTYEGSTWGKIVDILIQYKSMNPVIYFDELDKVSDTAKGEEIIGILTHLTDTSQNKEFHDKYFSGIDFDLSKALFIFSYNDEKKINPILKDRMYRIQTNGYSNKDKIVIAKDYLVPSIERNINFDKEQIVVDTKTIEYLIENFTEKEKGVRNLKRCLEIIFTKLNMYRLMDKETKLFNDDENNNILDVQFPFDVSKDNIDKLIKKNKEELFWLKMYS